MKFTKHIKHIIWDWNGTLVDDTRYCVDLINGILARRSLPGIDEGRYKRTFNFPIIDYYKRIGLDLEKETFETISNELISAYIHSRHNLILHDGALKALNFFDARKLPQCMLSASQHETLLQTLKEHGIENYFKTVLGLDDHFAFGKIHLGKTWIENNKIEKNHVLFIGDTLHDLEVANEMGIHCILVATGHQSKKRLSKRHPHVLDSLNQLIELFNA